MDDKYTNIFEKEKLGEEQILFLVKSSKWIENWEISKIHATP